MSSVPIAPSRILIALPDPYVLDVTAQYGECPRDASEPEAFRVLALPIEDANGSVALLGATLVIALMLGVAAGDPDAAQVFAIPLALVVYGLVLLMPSYVMIGAEGLRVTWMRREKIIRFDDVAAISGSQNRVEIRTRGGELVALELLRGITDRSRADDEARALRERVAEALRAYAERAHADDRAAALVARDGRSAWAWLGQVRHLLASSYRGAALGPERLWRVIGDPEAEPSARVGAAAALRTSMDACALAKLRDLASESVVAELRAGLLAVREAATDDDLLAAIEPCGSEERCSSENLGTPD
jgi:hypothetical protein